MNLLLFIEDGVVDDDVRREDVDGVVNAWHWAMRSSTAAVVAAVPLDGTVIVLLDSIYVEGEGRFSLWGVVDAVL